MKRRGILSIVQSLGVIAFCAAVAYSLSRFPNMELSDGPMLAFVGAALGLVGVCAGLFMRPSVQAYEARNTRGLKWLRLTTVCLIVAAGAWLGSVLVPSTAWNWVFFVAAIGGLIGILGHNATRSKVAE
jgi:hypothetical protein